MVSYADVWWGMTPSAVSGFEVDAVWLAETAVHEVKVRLMTAATIARPAVIRRLAASGELIGEHANSSAGRMLPERLRFSIHFG